MSSEELSRPEKTLVCFSIADAIDKLQKRLDRINEKIYKGEKTFYVVGIGSEDIHKVRDRTLKEMELLNNASKKLTCSL